MMFPTFSRWYISVRVSLSSISFSSIGTSIRAFHLRRAAAASARTLPDDTTRSLRTIALVLYAWQLLAYLWMESAANHSSSADASMGSVFTYFLFGLAPSVIFSLPLIPLAYVCLIVVSEVGSLLSHSYVFHEFLNQLVFLATMMVSAHVYGMALIFFRNRRHAKGPH